VIALGAHILDTLVTPVEVIPDGQVGVIVDRIKLTAAGPAGGRAVALAKLGATVLCRRSPLTWSTPPAVVTPSRPVVCAA
ncbi:MAG TPA: hypothetical protein VN408_04310, partial [Actinoplanes sp.]|nr:hypothetical protein [Actinoplanes sp.]